MAVFRKILLDAEAVDNATVNTSEVSLLKINGNGVMSIRLISSAAGGLTIDYQCSPDGKLNWYTPVDVNNVSVGRLATLTAADTGRLISFSPVIAPFIRFQAVEDNTLATNVTLEVMFLEK